MPTISVFPDGSAEFTRNNALQAIMPSGRMERVTEIHKFDGEESYYIRWLLGPYVGCAHTYSIAVEYGCYPDENKPPKANPPTDMVMTFPTYEAAVAHEVAVLDAMRKHGVSFRGSRS